MSPSIAFKTMALLKRQPHSKIESKTVFTELSGREVEILEQLSKGFTNKIIAENLFISPFTVKRHIENIYQKLQAHNRTELLDTARKHNFL